MMSAFKEQHGALYMLQRAYACRPVLLLVLASLAQLG